MSTKLTIPSSAHTQRFDRWMKKTYSHIPFGVLQKWLRTGQVRINGKRVKGNYILSKGDEVRFPPQFQETGTVHAAKSKIPTQNPKTRKLISQSVLYEDASCVIIEKPQGLPVQGGTGLTDYLDLYLSDLLGADQEEPLKLVHRLDKDTHGLLVLAKNLESARQLTNAFKEGKVQKTYHAVLVGRPSTRKGTIDLPLGKLEGAAKERVSSEAPKTDPALTHFETLAYDKESDVCLIKLMPQTGRMHQLRVHMLEGLGHPILGDGKYGGKDAQPFDKRLTMHLAATGLCFVSPANKRVDLSLPLPDFFVLKN